MSTYHIYDIERLTGIKAHTIRIWEKRYQIVNPHRTPTNIRYYDDDQLRKLLNVSTLLQQGKKISAISQLSEQEIANEIVVIGEEETSSEDIIIQGYINNLIAFMASFDEDGFEKTFSIAVKKLGIYKAMVKVFYPFLFKTGILWSANNIMPAQEHFAVNIIKRKLIAVIDKLPRTSKTPKKFVLFLPPGEWHEMSLLFSDYIIRSKGYKTLYLGQSVPLENLDTTIAKYKPTHLLTFLIAEKDITSIETAINALAKKYAKLAIWVSGSSIVNYKYHFQKNVVCITDPATISKLLI